MMTFFGNLQFLLNASKKLKINQSFNNMYLFRLELYFFPTLHISPKNLYFWKVTLIYPKVGNSLRSKNWILIVIVTFVFKNGRGISKYTWWLSCFHKIVFLMLKIYWIVTVPVVMLYFPWIRDGFLKNKFWLSFGLFCPGRAT